MIRDFIHLIQSKCRHYAFGPAVRDLVRTEGFKNGLFLLGVLAFARALGEYGATSMVAGYTPGRTATVSTTVYQLWRTGDDAGALRWVLVNIALSACFLLAVNLLEERERRAGRRRQG